MKRCFEFFLVTIVLVIMISGCSKTNSEDDISDDDNISVEDEADTDVTDKDILNLGESNAKDFESEDDSNVTRDANEGIIDIFGTRKNHNEYELVRVESFNEEGYAWITVKQDDVRSYALLNDSLDVCFILQLDYDEISKISSFESGSALIEMNDGIKHIIGSDGTILFTLDKNSENANKTSQKTDEEDAAAEEKKESKVEEEKKESKDEYGGKDGAKGAAEEKEGVPEYDEKSWEEDYDDILKGSNGYYIVSRTTSGFDDYGTDYGIADAYGHLVLPLRRINGFWDAGSGVFATTTNRGEIIFYNAETDEQFEIDGLVPGFLWSISEDLFVNGKALVELGSGRMGDKAAITFADSGNTVKIDINTEYAFYDYGPISDGGFIYFSHEYENGGTVVTSIRYFDMETFESYSIFNQPRRIKYENTTTPLRSLKFFDGYTAIEMLGADGKTYFSIIDKYGDITYGPQSDINSLRNIGEGYFVLSNDEGNKIIKANGDPGLTVIPQRVFSCGYAVDRTGRNYIDRYGNIVFEKNTITYNPKKTIDNDKK